MKYILFTFTFAASVCTAPVLFAGSGLMDDLIKPYDDTLIELPGESTRKPSVSRSAQLVDDSATDTWGSRDNDSSATGKNASSTSGSSSSSSSSSKSTKSSSSGSSSSSSSSPASTRSKSFNADGSYIPYSERYPEEQKEKAESGFDRDTFDPNFNPFKNNYKYKDTDYKPNGTRPEYEETRRKIKDVLGEGVQKVIVDPKADELIHNSARSATLEAPTTPNHWTRAPNGWFCDFDDVMEKAQQTGKAVAVFFHSSDNDNSRKFKTERMESSKFKSKMRDRLLVVYLDYPDNAGTSKDKRYRDQAEHNTKVAEKFHVSYYPTVVILNSSGSELGRLDTNTNSVSTFVEKADKIVPQREEKEKKGGFKIGGGIGMGESGVTRSSD